MPALTWGSDRVGHVASNTWIPGDEQEMPKKGLWKQLKVIFYGSRETQGLMRTKAHHPPQREDVLLVAASVVQAVRLDTLSHWHLQVPGLQASGAEKDTALHLWGAMPGVLQLFIDVCEKHEAHQAGVHA